MNIRNIDKYIFTGWIALLVLVVLYEFIGDLDGKFLVALFAFFLASFQMYETKKNNLFSHMPVFSLTSKLEVPKEGVLKAKNVGNGPAKILDVKITLFDDEFDFTLPDSDKNPEPNSIHFFKEKFKDYTGVDPSEQNVFLFSTFAKGEWVGSGETLEFLRLRFSSEDYESLEEGSKAIVLAVFSCISFKIGFESVHKKFGFEQRSAMACDSDISRLATKFKLNRLLGVK